MSLQQQHELEELYGVEDVSRILGVPVRTLYAWRTERRGPRSFRVGRYVRYRRSDVADWIAGRSAS